MSYLQVDYFFLVRQNTQLAITTALLIVYYLMLITFFSKVKYTISNAIVIANCIYLMLITFS